MRSPPKKTSIDKVDWKQFSASPDLQSQYAVTVKNRYQELEQLAENEAVENVELESDAAATARYQRFVDANTEAMQNLPKLKRLRKKRYANHPEVDAAREQAAKLSVPTVRTKQRRRGNR